VYSQERVGIIQEGGLTGWGAGQEFFGRGHWLSGKKMGPERKKVFRQNYHFGVLDFYVGAPSRGGDNGKISTGRGRGGGAQNPNSVAHFLWLR